MMGMLFWGGTYVFAGNPSFDTLASGPARGAAHRASSASRGAGRSCASAAWRGARATDGRCARSSGDRLRWGLSAAGHLDPAVFRYFQRHGVELCSGFGMTEGTGGITMTPPGEYEDGSVGRAAARHRGAALADRGAGDRRALRGPLPRRPGAGAGRGALAPDRRHLRAPAERALRDRRPREGRLQEHARPDGRAGRRRAAPRRRAGREAGLPRRATGATTTPC